MEAWPLQIVSTLRALQPGFSVRLHFEEDDTGISNWREDDDWDNMTIWLDEPGLFAVFFQNQISEYVRLNDVAEWVHSIDTNRVVYFRVFRNPPLVANEGQRLQNFLNRRSENTPNGIGSTYRIDDFVSPIYIEEVRNRSRALYIQENVTDGLIHGLYNPEELHQWFGIQGKTTSPHTRKEVRLPFRRLPRYLLNR
jgi:hypothetical protein